MKLGLYGGSFDPLHNGHLLVAQAAMEEACLDRLVFIPTAQSPFKTAGVAQPADLRLRMLRMALAGVTWADVDDQEVRRGGVSYTITTVSNYAKHFPEAELFYLIGADNVEALPSWRSAMELAVLSRFLIIPRPGVEPCGLPQPFRGQLLAGTPAAISSSGIRERIRSGKSIRHLVPGPVGDVIMNNRLYL